MKACAGPPDLRGIEQRQHLHAAVAAAHGQIASTSWAGRSARRKVARADARPSRRRTRERSKTGSSAPDRIPGAAARRRQRSNVREQTGRLARPVPPSPRPQTERLRHRRCDEPRHFGGDSLMLVTTENGQHRRRRAAARRGQETLLHASWPLSASSIRFSRHRALLDRADDGLEGRPPARPASGCTARPHRTRPAPPTPSPRL